MKPPSRHRILAFLLIAIQSAALALLSEHSGFALFVTGAALALLPGWFQLRPSPRTKQVVALILAIGFVAKSQLTPPGEFLGFRAFLPYAHGYAVCQFCLTLQMILLFLDSREGRPHAFPLFLGVVTLVYAANKYAEPVEAQAYRFLVLLFLVVAAFFLAGIRQSGGAPAPSRAGRRLRTALLALAAAFVCVLAVAAGNLMKAAEPKLQQMLERMHWGADYDEAEPGFSTYSHLGNVLAWKLTYQDATALRVISPRPPGYLRGRVFEHFDGREWGPWSGDEGKRRELSFRERIEGLPPLETEEYLFDIREKGPNSSPSEFGAGDWWALDVRPLEPIGDVLFTRLGASLMGAQLSYLFVSPSGAAEFHEPPLGGKYRLFVPAKPETPGLAERGRYLQVPDRLDSRVREIAEEIFRGRETVIEKTKAVESYFRTNYEYALLPAFAGGRWRMGRFNYFMLQRPAAHCEFFASGAVVLLRLAGVPCRYVTGFVVAEKNGYGDYWVARNRDAHAWAEAFDEERGWIIVEATPPAGVPGFEAEQGAVAQLWDAVKFSLSKTRSGIQTGGLRRFLLDLLDAILWKTLYLKTLPGLLVALCFLAAGVLFLVRNRRRRKPAPDDPILVALHRLLAQVDRKLARRALRRLSTETLHHFADRILAGEPDDAIRKAAGWYRQYAALRYGQPLKPESVQSLRETMPV